MNRLIKPAFAAVVLAFLGSASAWGQDAAWVKQSNADSQVLLKVFGDFAPEFAGQSGVDGLDDKIFDLKPGLYKRGQAAGQKAVAELRKRYQAETDPLVKQDLAILIGAGEQNLTTNELQHKYLLQFFDPAQIEFSGIRFLLDKQVPQERQKHALTRLKLYAGAAPGVTPLALLAEQRSA